MAIETNIERLVTDFTCGFCFSQSGYEIAFADHSELRPYGIPASIGRAFAVVRCRSCGMLNVLFFAVEDEEPFPMENDILVDIYLEEHPEIIDEGELHEFGVGDVSYVVIPPARLKRMGQYPYGYRFEGDVPEPIRQDIQEAGNCLSVGAANSSAVMCRRAVERLAKSLGVQVKPRERLCGILTKLKEQGHIDETLFTAMMEIKDWGNIGAHAGEEDNLGFDEAHQILSLVVQVTDYACSNQKARLETSTRKLSVSRNQ